MWGVPFSNASVLLLTVLKNDIGIIFGKKENMKKIIWMEMLLLGSSILIFRSVWAFLDTLSWAREMRGLGLLLVAGIAMTLFALFKIHATEAGNQDKLKK